MCSQQMLALSVWHREGRWSWIQPELEEKRRDDTRHGQKMGWWAGGGGLHFEATLDCIVVATPDMVYTTPGAMGFPRNPHGDLSH